jgi:hypothetical protein
MPFYTAHFFYFISLPHIPSVLDTFTVRHNCSQFHNTAHPDNSYCPMPVLKSSLNQIKKKKHKIPRAVKIQIIVF